MDSLEEFLVITRIKNPCDLDLLLFFARHPDALMTSEQLAVLVGYDLQQIAKSLDLLVERKVLRRKQNPTHPARLYRFRADHWDPRFRDTLKVASTVEGRREINRVLSQRQRPKGRTPRNHLAAIKSERSEVSEKNSMEQGARRMENRDGRPVAPTEVKEQRSDASQRKEKAHG